MTPDSPEPARAAAAANPVDRQRAAYNAHDLNAFLACFAANVIVYDSDGHITAENRNGLKATYETLFARSPHVRVRARQRIRLGPGEHRVIIDEEHVSGYVSSGGEERRFVLAVMYEVDRELIHVVRFLTPPYAKAPRAAAPA